MIIQFDMDCKGNLSAHVFRTSIDSDALVEVAWKYGKLPDDFYAIMEFINEYTSKELCDIECY